MERKRGARPGRLSDRLRDEIEHRVVAGETEVEVAAAVGCDPRTVIRWITRSGGVRSYERRRSQRALSLPEREEIALAVERGESGVAIAARLGRATSTVTRELARNGGRRGYRAARADARALEQARRPKLAKLVRSPRLRVEVERRLGERWSPQQIAARLRLDFPDDPEMRVSHETIYQSLYVQSRGALRRELAGQLRLGRARRRSRGVRPGGGLREIVPIAKRPAEVADRAVPGHWEGDLILGKAGRSAIATLVERQTRFTMLIQLPAGRSAESVRVALTESIQRLPEALRRTLTWDQGKEMAEHARFTVDSQVQVYFCDPSSPWQRGTSENTNGLLRQYLPKGDDLARYQQAELDSIADQLNGRPRQTLKWLKPSEAFDQLIATTA
ncbi:MAG: IS30 family transposase [Actinomycetota bacterium]|nr:IS30 family transposase [Actinomycetota bacterium]